MRSVCILVEHKLLFFTSRPGSSSKARIALLSVAVFLFLCSSALWAMDVVDVTLNIRNVWINNLDLPLEERIQKGREITSLVNWVEDIVYSFEVRMHVSVTSILTILKLTPVQVRARRLHSRLESLCSSTRGAE